MLQRQTRPPRLTIRWRPVVVAALGSAALALAMLSWPGLSVVPVKAVVVAPAPAAEVITVPGECPAPISVEPSPPPPRFGDGSCPPMDPPRDPRVGVAWTETFQTDSRELDGLELIGVAVSPARHGVLAVWSAGDVLVSTDDGRSFRALPSLPATLIDVAVDCRGAVVVLVADGDGAQLGFHRDGVTRWRQLPAPMGQVPGEGDSISLTAGGGWIAISASVRWLGGEDRWRPEISVSGDGGASWRTPLLGGDDAELIEGIAVDRIDAGGNITALGFEGDCMYDGTSVFRGRLSMKRALVGTNISGSYQLHEAALAGRWVYSTRECDGSVVCARDWRAPDSSWGAIVGLPAPTEAESCDDDLLVPRILPGQRSYVQHGQQLFRLQGAQATTVESALPAGAELQVVDSSGRLLGFDGDGQLIRWSPRHRTRLLRGQANPESDAEQD